MGRKKIEHERIQISAQLTPMVRLHLDELAQKWGLGVGVSICQCIELVHRAIHEKPKLAPAPKAAPKPTGDAEILGRDFATRRGPTPADPYAGLTDVPPRVVVTRLPAHRARGV